MVDVSLRPKRRPDDLLKNKKVSPVMGRSDPQNRIGTSGPKGGGEGATARVKPGSDVYNQYNNDSSYGYYTEEGLYVPADIDMRDGGGINASGTYYEGGGLLSALGNVFKVRPYGQENTPIEQIGYRDFTDMTDRGGPQASGGRYQGGGMISVMGNLLDDLGGVDQGTRTPYVYETSTATPTVTANTQRNYVGSGANPSNAYGYSPTYVSDVFNAPPMPNVANILDNTQFDPPTKTMDEIRRNMAREILLEKYGVNFFTMPEETKEMYMQDELQKMGTGF